MIYSPENTQVTLTLPNGQSHIITGWATDAPEIEQFWHKLLGVEDGVEGGVYVVKCIENDFRYSVVRFTEDGYNKHIKDLKPSIKSPFCFKEVDL